MVNVNHGQGVGFKIGGTVIDKRMLIKLATQIGVLASTVLPVALAVSASTKSATAAAAAAAAVVATDAAEPAACGLTITQVAGLQLHGELLQASFFANSSAACIYNTTLSEIMAMGPP